MKKDGFYKRFLTIVIWNNPLIVNPTFSKTEIVIGKSDFAHIMHFQ